MDDVKLGEAVSLLSKSLKALRQDPDDKVIFAAVSKTYEVAFEYIWKYFKRRADQAGMEIYSPRDALKAAAQLGLIDDLELWNNFLNARNLSVHDYIGIENEAFLPIIEKFEKAAKRVIA